LFEDEPDKESPEYQLAEAELSIAAESATGNLMKGFNEIELPKKFTPEDQEKINTDLIESWKVPFQTDILPNLKSIKVEDMEVELSKETIETIQQALAGSIVDRRLPATKESVEELQAIAFNMAVINEFPKIIKASVEKRDAYWKEHIATEYHGAKKVGKEESAAPVTLDPNKAELERMRGDMRKEGYYVKSN
jgi:hypothetical protein